jgi:glutaminyl-peptide cyclotransferase
MKNSLITLLTIGLAIGCTNNTHNNKIGIHRNEDQVHTISYKIVKTYPHDTGSFTEGFLFHNNKLFESTGSPEEFPDARSVFGPVDIKTGKISVKAELDRKSYFGESIVFWKDKIYQLTYKNQVGFIYESKTYKRIGSFTFLNKEGWGLTTDGNNIIMSDGTNIITFLNPDSLKVIKTQNITYNGSSALYINELEYINGYLYANIWTTNNIAKIDIQTGRIIGLIDLTPLYIEAKKKYPLSEATNGIAFDPTKDKIFVTGKFWPTIYQIKFRH